MKQTIYGLDSKQNLKVLSVWPEGDKMIQENGRYNGKMAKREKQCHAKNTGRANATTAEEQAQLHCDRAITKKIEQEYYFHAPEGIEFSAADFEASMKVYIKGKLDAENDAPMLAYPIEKGSKHIDWKNGVLASTKLDGIRCIAVYRDGKLTLKSRKNKPIETMEHIRKALEPTMKYYAEEYYGGTLRLDGELYNHTYHDNFEELVSAIKKYRPGTSELVKYYIYDAINPEWTAIDRTGVYKNVCMDVLEKDINAPIVSVEQTPIYSQSELDEFHAKCLAANYEGSMIKNSESLYKQSRSFDLLKIKTFSDAEYEIRDVIPMDADPTQGLYVCYCTKTGKTFKATPKCTVEKKQETLQNKEDYIGKFLTVKYFELTSDGIPRFPVGLAVRDYE